MRRPRLLLCLLCLVGALSGCGQSGPLYLPGSPSEMTTVPPAPEAADGEQADDSDDGDSE